ncbi:kinase [Thraustotheca clavata]|uniref:Kinase n=1 Tax=Thraustotheca clavata TaxID=74557 RepID=A0A1V9YQX8_9STRA|nr:kinase [Thraustotheca clavata]
MVKEVVFYGDDVEVASVDEDYEDDGELVHSNTVLACEADYIQYKGVFQGIDVAVQTAWDSSRILTLRAEAKVLTRIESDYIVKLLSLRHESTNCPEMVLEYMDIGHLRGYLDNKLNGKPNPIEFTKYELAFAVASAVNDLHDQGIIHRDIKTTNVLLSSDRKIKLGHLGYAKVVDGSKMELGVGTLCYMAPEVFINNNYSFPADIYSLGVVLSEIQALHKPYGTLNIQIWDLIAHIRDGKLRPKVSDNCEEWYRNLTDDCLNFDPKLRPTAKDVLQCIAQHGNIP